MCTAFTTGCNRAFSRENKLSGFSGSGTWPLVPEVLLSRPLPCNYDDIVTVIEKDELLRIFDVNRQNHPTRTVFNNIAIVTPRKLSFLSSFSPFSFNCFV